MITTESGEDDGIIFAFAQSVGEKKAQEDAFGHFETECFCVADGLSSSKSAKEASAFAVDNALFAYRNLRLKHFYWRAREHLVRQLYRSVSQTTFRKNKKSAIDMATTLTVSCFSAGWWWVGNVGDSRAYRLRDNNLQQLTKDHADNEGKITRWIGMEKFVAPDQFGGELLAGDVFLLTTDGLIKGMSDKTIHTNLSNVEDTPESLETQARDMVQQGLNSDSSDNITIGIIKKAKK